MLTVQDCATHIEHTLGGEMSPGISQMTIINQAGEYLVTIHPWKWLENVEAKLDLRGKILATGMDWDQSERTLTESGQFANYTFLEGDMIEITAGTGVPLGWYRIGKKTDDNTIVLGADIKSTDVTDDKIKGTIHTSAVALPSDFRELIAINTTSGLLKGVQLTSYNDLIQRRAAGFTSNGFHWGTITHAVDEDGDYTGDVTPRLEIWPTPSSNETGALTIFYRKGWSTRSSHSQQLRIPTYLDSFFLQICRAFARGIEEEDEGTLNQRLTEATSGPLFLSAIDRDGSIQPHYGALRTGSIHHPFESPFNNFNTISGPS